MERKKKNREAKEFLSEANGPVKEEDIRALAYQLFCESGYQQGKDREHWLEAEQRLLGKTKTGKGTPIPGRLPSLSRMRRPIDY